MNILRELNELELLLHIKHMPGRHSQQTHAGSRGAPVSAMFPNSKRVMFNTPDAERRVGEILDKLPSKARDLLVTTSEDMSFWTLDKSRSAGDYTYSGGHRISFSDDLAALEEFGHAVDKELGLRRGRAAEYSRSKAWRDVIQQEHGGIGTNPIKARAMGYTTGLATEDFAKTFADYVDRPDVLAERRPVRYAHMDELFGE